MRRTSYGRVREMAAGLAPRLAERKIAPGERILLWGRNSAAWVAAFWGAVARGVVVVPMDRIASLEFARRVARQVDAKLVVAERGLPSTSLELPEIFFEEFERFSSSPSRTGLEIPAVKRDDAVEIIFTSGTTAEPRGVVLTHGNLLANLEPFEREISRYSRYERIFHPLKFLNLLPLSHVFGQMLGILIPQLIGATVIFLDTQSPPDIMQVIRRERVSVIAGVPRTFESLAERIRREHGSGEEGGRFERDFQFAEGKKFLRRWWIFRRIHRKLGWKFWALISGGATLPEETENFWSRLGYAVIQGYGLTETTSLVSVNHPFRLSRGSIGKALPGVEIKLAENGEILIRGENVAAGYWKERRINAVAGEEGWFHTGDLGKRDATGNLYFRGRLKNVIVTAAGMNIYPEDLEAALRRELDVRECVVVRLERDGNAEACAVLLLREDARSPEAIVRAANASLAEYQHIRRWMVWKEPDFPRTPTQKPSLAKIEAAMRAEFAEGKAASAGDGPLAEMIEKITRRPVGKISAEANLSSDLGLSSLDRVELLSALEDRFQVELSDTKFTAVATVGELESILRKPESKPQEHDFPRWAQRWPIAWLRTFVHYLLVWPATRLLTYPKITGRRNLRQVQGPVLIVSNHVAYLDAGFVLAALTPRLRHRLAIGMQAEELSGLRRPARDLNIFRRLLLRTQYFLVVALFNVFPLPRESDFRSSFLFAGDLADRGWSILVFPEGHRTEDGGIAPFRSGIGLLATQLALPVVPMRIKGLFDLRQRRKRYARPGTVSVSVGEPVCFTLQTAPESIARELERRVREL